MNQSQDPNRSISSKRETRQSAAKFGTQEQAALNSTKIEAATFTDGKKLVKPDKNHSRQKSKGGKFVHDDKENDEPMVLKNEQPKKSGLRQSQSVGKIGASEANQRKAPGIEDNTQASVLKEKVFDSSKCVGDQFQQAQVVSEKR